MGKPRGSSPQTKINVTSKSPVGDISVVTLIRTDTTLDHSQKAEKVCYSKVRKSYCRIQFRMYDSSAQCCAYPHIVYNWEGGNKGKRPELRCLSATEVTASRSGLLSHHCRWCSVLPALLPAWAGSRVTTCQAAPTYEGASLQTTCLVGASHPHGKQDMPRSTALHQSSPHAGHREA